MRGARRRRRGTARKQRAWLLAREAAVAAKIGLFRASGSAVETLAALRRLGFEGVSAPVTELVALEPAPPLGEFALLLATSGAAFAYAGPWLTPDFEDTPKFIVGARTNRGAMLRGLDGEGRVFRDVAALIAALPEPHGGVALYLAGRERKRDLELALGERGMDFVTVETYAAEARAAWTDGEVEALRECDVFLHYSRRSAELALALAVAAGLGAAFECGVHVAISADVAVALRGLKDVFLAETPDEAGLLAALGKRPLPPLRGKVSGEA